MANNGGRSGPLSIEGIAMLEPLTVTVQEALRLTGLGRTSLYRLIDEKKLRRVKVGSRTLIDYGSIKKLVKAATEK